MTTKVVQKKAMRKAKGKGVRSGPQRPSVQDVLVPRDFIPRRSPELKHLDVTSGGYVLGVSQAGSITHVTPMSQGGAGNQRIGDSVVVRGIDFRLGAYAQGTNNSMTRFTMFTWNMDSTVAAPGVSDIWQGGGGATSLTVVAPYNSDRVEAGALGIVFDETIALRASPDTYSFRFSKPVNFPIAYVAGQLTGTGTLRLAIVSDAALAANACNYQWWCRVYYDDV